MKAAEAGFNVFLFDCDDGAHIGTQINQEGRKKIHVLDAVDEIGKPVAAKYLINILKGRKFLWDSDNKSMISNPVVANPEHEHYLFDITKLGPNDVLIIDSHTAYTRSIAWQYAIDNSIDMTSFDKPDWPGYAFCGMLIDWEMQQLKALKCHVILIGHSTVYEKYKGEGRDRKLDWQRTQLVSSSGPQAMRIGGNFSEVLYFTIVGAGVKIDTRAEADRDGGTRIVLPGMYSWEELQFSDIIKLANLELPIDAPLSEGIVRYQPGAEIPSDILQTTAVKNLFAPKAAPIPAAAPSTDPSGSSITALMNPK